MVGLRRAGLGCVAGLVAVIALAGCVPFGVACPAVGWSNSLIVELYGDTSSVELVQVCTDDGCAPAADIDPTGPLGLVAAEQQDDSTWTLQLGMMAADYLTVRALDVAGLVLADAEVTPEWVRVGGDARCGGPAEATVALHL